MDVRSGLQPRHPVTAARTAGLLTLLGAGVSLFFAIVQPPSSDVAGRLAALLVPAVLLGASLLLARARSHQERLMVQLQRAAAIDPLTGLVTRRVLDEAAQTALSTAGQDEGTALVLIDLDRFKSINDTYGHPVGDAVLVHVSEVLARQTRSDTVVCRMGGDEIAVLLPGCSHDTAVRRAQDLLEAVHAHPFQLSDGTLVAISVSIGVAQVPVHAAELNRLYTVADQALYEAKRAGRGRVSAPPDHSRPSRTVTE
jgi:diguanylate cyclase (GGDEF)-like protein